MDNIQNQQLLTRGRVLRGILLLYDITVVNAAYFIALILRFSDTDSMRNSGLMYIQMFKDYALWYTIACIFLFMLFRLYSIVWKYAGFYDVKRLAVVNVITCVLYICGSLLVVGRMPISVYIMGAFFQFVLMCAVRIAPRYILETFGESKPNNNKDVKIPLMIVGLGENARIIQNKITRDKSTIIQPVCVLDHAYSYKGDSFNGLPVYSGSDAINECIDKFDIRCVIIAEGNLPREFVDKVRNVCEKKGIELRDFVIGTGYRSLDVRLGELLSRTEGEVVVLSNTDNEEHRYSDGKAAVRDWGTRFFVESISARDGEIVVHTRKSDKDDDVHDLNNEDWINKYREETGDEVSFF